MRGTVETGSDGKGEVREIFESGAFDIEPVGTDFAAQPGEFRVAPHRLREQAIHVRLRRKVARKPLGYAQCPPCRAAENPVEVRAIGGQPGGHGNDPGTQRGALILDRQRGRRRCRPGLDAHPGEGVEFVEQALVLPQEAKHLGVRG